MCLIPKCQELWEIVLFNYRFFNFHCFNMVISETIQVIQLKSSMCDNIILLEGSMSQDFHFGHGCCFMLKNL